MDSKRDPLTAAGAVFGLATISCLLWGSAFPLIKLGYRYLGIRGITSQILFAGLRFTLAGILTVGLGKAVFKGKWLPKKSALPSILWLALFQTILQYTFFYVSLGHLSGVRGSILNGTGTFWAILIACLVFHQEKLNVRKIAGCLLGFAGILLVNLSGLKTGEAPFSLLGDGFMILSTIASSVSAALLRQFGRKEAPYLLSGCQFFLGGLVLTAFGLVSGGHFGTVTPQGVLILIALAFVSAIAYGLWALLLAHNPVSKVQIYFFITPVAGVFLSAWFLGERSQALGWPALLALLCVSGGIYIVNRPQKSNTIKEKKIS